MKLFNKRLGNGEPLVILHGLYGSSDNWMSVGRVLSQQYSVFLVDQRNHGRSPHSPSHTYKDLTDDLLELFDDEKVSEAIVVGHSMGGKVAMQFAANNPSRVKGLIVIDILPSSYRGLNQEGFGQENQHARILSSMLMLRLDLATSRDDLDSALSHQISHKPIRQFLLKSVKRNDEGKFVWQLNVEALSRNLDSLMGEVLPVGGSEPISVPTIFIKGALSNYVYPEGEEQLKRLFTNYSVKSIANAGHWVHAENPKDLLIAINNFIDNLG
jgi:pimeloyl-ACP methyl ester carboxylesterase